MLWRSTTLIGSGIRARDGEIGSIADLLFDETDWTVRWVLVDTGTWLTGRRVLLPPSCFGAPGGVTLEYPVDLTRKQVEESPEIDFDAPVSRQLESRVYSHYGWTPYWNLGYAPPFAAPGLLPTTGQAPPAPEPRQEPSGDPHLRSAREVTGYYVQATDGDIGHVEEFLVDDESWVIRYAMIDTANWWPARKVLLSPRSFREIDWATQKVRVDVTREQVKASPEYDPSTTLQRDHEARLHAHYGVAPYWS
ncbi:PRC-barrel domain-containing protein [Falsiroseomonas sp.]|uniref:PRC-barrel domain-containing protein n=1 Tax=Falsiroseomonas sp. TaxID=2870721 RepID=UPI0035637780